MIESILFVVDGFNTKNGANSSFVQLHSILAPNFEIDVWTYGSKKSVRKLEIYQYNLVSSLKIRKHFISLEEAKRNVIKNNRTYKYIFIMSSICELLEKKIFEFFDSKFVRIVSFDVNAYPESSRRLRDFDIIVCQNKSQYSAILEKGEIPCNRLKFIYPSVHKKDEFKYLERQKLRPNCGSKLNITCIGSIQPRKNQLDVIRSLSKFPGATALQLVGPIADKKYFENCKKEVANQKKYTKVQFYGFKRSWRTFLWHSDLCVIPSHSEGLSNIVRYSLLMGVPMAINMELEPDAIFIDRYNCFLLDPPISESLPKKVASFREFGSISKNAKHTYKKYFSIEIQREGYLEILN